MRQPPPFCCRRRKRWKMKSFEYPAGEFRISIPGRGTKFKSTRFRMGPQGLEVYVGFTWARASREIQKKIEEGKYHIKGGKT